MSIREKLQLNQEKETFDSETEGLLSMNAGEFVKVYKNNYISHFDCICTVFFIDTANNILEYIDTIV